MESSKRNLPKWVPGLFIAILVAFAIYAIVTFIPVGKSLWTFGGKSEHGNTSTIFMGICMLSVFVISSLAPKKVRANGLFNYLWLTGSALVSILLYMVLLYFFGR